jgi:diguanylate cyclase (GGDEF)-like protein
MHLSTSPWAPFLILFSLAALIPTAGLSIYALQSISTRLDRVESNERFAVDLQRAAVATELRAVAKDLCVLAHQNELSQLMLEDRRQSRLAMAAEYLALARQAKDYDQIRFLDARGQEVIRINQNNGSPSIVPDTELQDKSSRYYVRQTLALEPGEVYASPLDLNIEHGSIEIPHKPMIRIGTPVSDADGEERGMVLINLKAQRMLDEVQATGAVSVGEPMLVNNDGYWLVTPDPPPGWGFMFPERVDERMPKRFPEAWARINEQPSGVVYTPQGMFTFENYYPLNGLTGCVERPGSGREMLNRNGYRWVLISHVPQARINDWRREAILQATLIGGVILILLAAGIWAWLVVASERRRHRKRLEHLARFDALTGLANRSTLEERLEEEIERSRRYGRGFTLIFLDLDGFKAINDRAGHQAGDRVLIEVAQVLETNCRATDLAARQGGDEFVVLLAEVAEPAIALKVAEKLRARIANITWDGTRLGASIGVALCPDHAQDAAPLMRQADEAMYRAKSGGKNRICLAGDHGHEPPS